MDNRPVELLNLKDLTDVSSELSRIDDLANAVSHTLTNAFRGALLESKSLKSVLLDIGRAFADIALKAALKPLGDLAGNLVNSLFTATNPVLNNIKPFAQGGVISSPAMFSLGGNIPGAGLGLAGEAGPEAILPLRRGPDGSLGVQAGVGAGNMTINFNVTTRDANSFKTAEAEISAMVLRAIRRGTRAS